LFCVTLSHNVVIVIALCCCLLFSCPMPRCAVVFVVSYCVFLCCVVLSRSVLTCVVPPSIVFVLSFLVLTYDTCCRLRQRTKWKNHQSRILFLLSSRVVSCLSCLVLFLPCLVLSSCPCPVLCSAVLCCVVLCCLSLGLGIKGSVMVFGRLVRVFVLHSLTTSSSTHLGPIPYYHAIESAPAPPPLSAHFRLGLGLVLGLGLGLGLGLLEVGIRVRIEG
jgi:hypothetical protein